MKNILNFLLEVDKLKEMPRTGLVTWRVKNPATIADHIFRVAFTLWLLGQKKNLDIKRVIKYALFHDLCEVYAGDLTPLFYYMKRTKKIMRGIRLSKKERVKRVKKKFEIEKKSLLKLIRFLKPELKNEIFLFWLNYETGISKEARLIREMNRVDALLESLEYVGTNEDITGTAWWEIAEESIADSLLVEFLKIIQKKFYGKVAGEYKKDKELENILDFLLEIGKLKRMPRTLWRSLGIKNPETVAGHIFTVTLMAWIFGQENKNLNMEKLLKMALCHEMPSVYTGDLITPFRVSLKGVREIFKKWPRFSKKEKEKIFYEDYKKEKEALKKLTLKLEAPLRKEIIQLWDEYKTASTFEARFLNQINVLAVLLQGLRYQEKDKNLPIDWMWEWAFEKCESPVCFEFIEELKRKFYKRGLIPKVILNFLRIK